MVLKNYLRNFMVTVLRTAIFNDISHLQQYTPPNAGVGCFALSFHTSVAVCLIQFKGLHIIHSMAIYHNIFNSKYYKPSPIETNYSQINLITMPNKRKKILDYGFHKRLLLYIPGVMVVEEHNEQEGQQQQEEEHCVVGRRPD